MILLFTKPNIEVSGWQYQIKKHITHIVYQPFSRLMPLTKLPWPCQKIVTKPIDDIIGHRIWPNCSFYGKLGGFSTTVFLIITIFWKFFFHWQIEYLYMQTYLITSLINLLKNIVVLNRINVKWSCCQLWHELSLIQLKWTLHSSI